jgi:hypothetical protein
LSVLEAKQATKTTSVYLSQTQILIPDPSAIMGNKEKINLFSVSLHGLGLCCLLWVFSLLSTRLCHPVGGRKESWLRLPGKEIKGEKRKYQVHVC